MTIRDDARQIIDESIRAVLPDVAVKRALSGRIFGGAVYVVAIGKAAWRMAAAAREVLGDRVRAGVVVTKYGHAEGPIAGMEIVEAGHPVPDERGIAGADRALAMTEGLCAQDTVVFLVSGGGSALFERPAEGISLSDIADVTRQLLASGADIVEMNTIRKRLSRVKGGRFALHCAPARVLSVVLSDVLGDSLDSIASGPAHPDTTSCQDAMRILSKYGITLPDHLAAAMARETPDALDNVETVITGNVGALCEAAKAEAERLAYRPMVLTTTLSAEARDAGAFLAAIAREIRGSGQPMRPPCAIILGGETVVHVRGGGKGGRNQELALAAAQGIAGLADVLLFSVGSDGTDGPTDAAGGMVDGTFWARAKAAGHSIDRHLADNDAYPLLQAMDGLIMTGPTGTNVNDLTVLLCR